MANAALAANGWLARLMPWLVWTRGFDRCALRVDLMAGITAGVLILPQAVALATLAGMPPEYGVYTSIIPVTVAALFGSSRQALSGPNTAVCVLIAIHLSSYASRETDEYIRYVLGLTLMVGGIQLAAGLLRLGSVFNFISHSVIVGMVAGVGVVIIVQQLGNFFGLLMNPREELYETAMQVWFNLGHANGYAAAAGLVTLIAGVLVKRLRPQWPHLIVAVVAGIFAGWFIDGLFGSANIKIDKLGTLTLATFPFRPVDLSTDAFVVYRELVAGAFLIALLGLMQSAVIARALAVKTGQSVNMNQEIIGQGLSNVVGSFLSCFASCGSFNRSAANLAAGARTPLAALVSSATLAALMPISVMASILFLVGWGFIDAEEIRKLINVREELIIFSACFVATVILGLDYAVMVGVSLSIIVYFRGVSQPEVAALTDEQAASVLPAGAHAATVLRVTGNLFFGSVTAIEQALGDLAARAGRARRLALALDRIGYLDTAAALMLAKEAARRRQEGGQLVLVLRDHRHDAVMRDSGLTEAVGKENIHYRTGATPIPESARPEAATAPILQNSPLPLAGEGSGRGCPLPPSPSFPLPQAGEGGEPSALRAIPFTRQEIKI